MLNYNYIILKYAKHAILKMCEINVNYFQIYPNAENYIKIIIQPTFRFPPFLNF